MFEDKTLVCKECGNASRNSEREMYETTCAECGAPTRVPFVPKTDRPIYCSECFAKKRGA